MNYTIFDPVNPPASIEKQEIVDFLHENLDQYKDSKKAISNCISYAMKENSVDGGFIIIGSVDGQTKGIVIVNRTGMKYYIPENILVYIAVRKDNRGKGYGKMLMEKAIEMSKGNIALHVEHDNPARFLYEKVGFENKYLEYRLYKS
ncbi:MAG: GNAT family N-acetyltransferase [Bacteroidales bacterium]|nr:GNAT family N-acetyltransferase [Bacteroidales bacterium]